LQKTGETRYKNYDTLTAVRAVGWMMKRSPWESKSFLNLNVFPEGCRGMGCENLFQTIAYGVQEISFLWKNSG